MTRKCEACGRKVVARGDFIVAACHGNGQHIIARKDGPAPRKRKAVKR